MANEKDDVSLKYTLRWKIENISQVWWLEKEHITSPTFIVDELKGTKWSLGLFFLPENQINIYLHREDCSGPHSVRVKYSLAFLGKGDSILLLIYSYLNLKERTYSHIIPMDAQRVVFRKGRENAFPEDTLTVQCALRKGRDVNVKPKYLYAQTVLKVIRKSFDWKIENFSTLQPGVIKEFKGDLIKFGLYFLLKEHSGKSLRIKIIPLRDCIKYISCNTSTINSEGREVGESIDVSSTVEHSDWRMYFSKDVQQQKDGNIAALIEDFKSMYNDPSSSDIDIRTADKIIPVHKSVLIARSPVFRRMFSHDMKEKISREVVIEDLDFDTVHRMLLFMYTGTLEGMTYESASKLYRAGDKYEIFSLRSSCSSFLKNYLCPATISPVMHLADQHRDDDLKNAVYVYILEHGRSLIR